MTRCNSVIRLIPVALWLALTASCGQADKAAIRASFDEYQKAEAVGDGQKAVMLVSRSTIDYFGEIQRAALEAEAAEIAPRSFCDRLFIACVRHYMDPKYVRQLSPEQLFMCGVRDGWLQGDQSEQEGIALGEIEIDGDRAYAALTKDGDEAPIRLEFCKEGGAWKQDVKAMLPQVERMLRQMLRGQNVDENQIILLGLSMRSGKPVSPTIWDKPKIK